MKVTATIWIDFETSAEEPVSKNVTFQEVMDALLKPSEVRSERWVGPDGEVLWIDKPEFSVEPAGEHILQNWPEES